MKKIIYICLTAIVLLAMNNKNSYSQGFVYPAIYNDLVAANVDGVENTGNDVREFSGNTYDMRIMTWDGDAPGFAWDDAFTGNTGNLDIEGVQQGTVTDPDIVLYDDGDMHTLIVYLLDDNVYYETWDYNAADNTWNLSGGPDPITNDGNCTCPNVDVDEIGNTVVVWEESDAIFATAGDIQGNFQPEFNINDEAHTPDVALNYAFANPSYTWVNFTFIHEDGNYEYLSWIGADYLTVYNGWPALGGPATFYTADLSDNAYFGRPRIAGPIYVDPGSPAEHEIVVEYYDGSGNHYIQGHNLNYVCPFIINISPFVDLTGEVNQDPAVTYCGDHIIVTWTYDDSGPGYTTGNVDVISRQLITYDGTAPNYFPFDTFSVVNIYTNDIQGISSVAGRFSTTAWGENKLITFFNEDISEVNYKIRPFASTQFRQKPPEINADVYPNPTSDIVNIKIDSEFETASLELYNLQGQRLIQKGITEQKFELDVSELNAGIYKLRIIANNSYKTKNISIIR